jgi:excisionase family DNA binding protein
MLKEKMLPISIFCLAISIVISASILTKGMKNNGEFIRTGLGDIGYGINNMSNNLNPNNNNQGIPKDNYNLFEGAIYLRISENKLMQLVNNKGAGIPYVKIGSDYIFNRNALDKWLETAKIEVQ